VKFFIKTFGCIQNTSDSERIKAHYWENGWQEVKNWKEADEVIINTCVIRQSAENRAYGFLRNVQKLGKKVVVTGCLVGVMNKNNKKKMETKKNFPGIEFRAIDKYVIDTEPIKKFKEWCWCRLAMAATICALTALCPKPKAKKFPDQWLKFWQMLMKRSKKGIKKFC